MSNYAAYIVGEPDIRYTTAEKTAILNYGGSRGGLFMISDHNISDRNNDGWDSPNVWNDLMASASPANPFGISFDLNNLTFTTGVGAAVAPTDSLLHGPAGNPVTMEYHNGASLTLSPSANASVLGALFQPSQATTGSTSVWWGHTRYDRGQVAALNDSSPPDDGTGAPGNNLYDGWATEAKSDHARILLNATIWLATATATRTATTADFMVYPIPATGTVFVSGNVLPAEIRCSNALGQQYPMAKAAGGTGAVRVETAALTPGIYMLSLRLPDGRVLTRRIARQ